jgi:hypothetical protein
VNRRFARLVPPTILLIPLSFRPLLARAAYLLFLFPEYLCALRRLAGAKSMPRLTAAIRWSALPARAPSLRAMPLASFCSDAMTAALSSSISHPMTRSTLSWSHLATSTAVLTIKLGGGGDGKSKVVHIGIKVSVVVVVLANVGNQAVKRLNAV